MRIRAKICGITRVEDAVAAVRCGADAIGLVFYEKSPRNVDVAQAKEIVSALPPFVMAVGLFVNENAETVRDIYQRVGLGLLQFHGDETPEYCQSFAAPYIKALR
ncbi:tryptophan biosynthesis protein, trpf, putative, partial [Ricinus communis]